MIKVRKAKLKDVDNIVILWNEFMEGHDKIVLKKTPQLKQFLIRKKNAAEIFRKFVKKNIMSKNGMVYLAEANNEPAGYSLVLIKSNIVVYKIKKVGYISDLYVRKDYRKNHISSRFKELAIKWLKENKIKHVSIAVHKENEVAYSIYKKWGFIDYHVELRKKI